MPKVAPKHHYRICGEVSAQHMRIFQENEKMEGRQYYELLKEPKDMTASEKMRLINIKHIPKSVRMLIKNEYMRISNEIYKLEEMISVYDEAEMAYPICAYRVELKVLKDRADELDAFISGDW